MWSTLRQHWMIFWVVWQEERKKNRDDRHFHETAFLPAVLEITDAPPSPAGRGIAWLLIVFFSIAVVWAVVGRVEIFATAQGRIIPTLRVKVIQPLESGVVNRILVKEGQKVESQELLVELDVADSNADETRISREWMESLADAARFRLLGEGDNNLDNFLPAAREFPSTMVESHLRLLARQWDEHQAQLNGLASERKQHESRLLSVGAEIKKLEMVLPLIRERARAKESLSKTGTAPRVDFLELEQKRIEIQETLSARRHDQEEIRAAVETLTLKIKQVRAQFRQSNWSHYLEADRKASALAQDLDKVRLRKKRGQLRSPEAGTVQQLKIFTVGGVVTPAQELMFIVPKDSALEVEAMVLNRDAGFIETGQSTEVKVETFPFTKYGTLVGMVRHISSDAIEDKSQGLVYPVRITMQSNTMLINGKSVPLVPGMAVTAEIATGYRRVIEYLLSPILKTRKDSLTER